MQSGRVAQTTAVLLVVLAVGLAGCADLPFVGPTCGRGGTDIGAIDGNGSEVHVKGELTAMNGSSIVVDDGTGQAAIIADNVGRTVTTGDCVVAVGQATPIEDSNHDVLVVPTNLWEEEWIPEEE